MKQIYSLLLSLVLLIPAYAQNPSMHRNVAKSYLSQTRGIVSEYKLVPYLLGSYYTKNSDDLAEYYLVCSSVSGQYDTSTGELYAPNAYVLYLSLYAAPNGGTSLPEGVYTKGDGTKPLTYDAEYTYIAVTNAQNEVKSRVPIVTDIEVTCPAQNQRMIIVTATVGGKEQKFRFRGTLSFSNTEQTTDIYHQLTHDVNTTFTGAQAWYYGNLYQANTGNMELRLYDCDFNHESGAMEGEGYAIKLSLFGPLFANPAEAVITPGHYTMARNFMRNTWFPGMEINYIGMVVPFGTFLQEHRNDPSFGDDGFGYAYITSGTIDIEELEGGVYRITLDLKSKTGYSVKGTYEGKIGVTDVSDDKKGAVVSTLTQDLELSLDYIPVAHAFNNGVQYNTRSISVDIGFDGSPDPDLCDAFVEEEMFSNSYGCDVFRMEFLVDPSEAYLPEGTYQVMEENYSNYYKPFRMRKGYFTDGGITGTRWVHFAPNRFYIMDGHSPADLGSVSVERTGKVNDKQQEIYTFYINIIDDAEFNITGKWTGPLDLRYDPVELGVHNVLMDGSDSCDRVYDVQGRRLRQTSDMRPGLYIQNSRKMIQR